MFIKINLNFSVKNLYVIESSYEAKFNATYPHLK